MKKVISILVVLVILVAAVWYFKNSDQVAESTPTPTPTATASANPSTTPAKSFVVNYSDTGYFPKTINVSPGTTIVFTNNSTHNMWTASDPHPIHTQYPVSGGCISSTFDACKGYAPGQSWEFTFTKVGTWGYHNHLRPSDTGTVSVH